MKKEGKEMENPANGNEITAERAQWILDILCDIYNRTRPVKQRFIVLDKKKPEEDEETPGLDGQAIAG
jgi:hypothetical protein